VAISRLLRPYGLAMTNGNMTRTDHIYQTLSKAIKRYEEPVVEKVAQGHDPYRVLISTMLSAQTKDSVTEKAQARLFKTAKTPKEILKLSLARLKKLIYPVSFYHTKARHLKELARILMEKHSSKVPKSMDELLALPGVGRKTANLVRILAFNEYGICVDTHVHRISNRLGLVKTKTPTETEFSLYQVLPKKYWKRWNELLVTWGQNVCVPVSPFCSRCAIRQRCAKVGVKKSR